MFVEGNRGGGVKVSRKSNKSMENFSDLTLIDFIEVLLIIIITVDMHGEVANQLAPPGLLLTNNVQLYLIFSIDSQ